MADDLLELVRSWRISMVALNKSPQTITSYTAAVEMFLSWCAQEGVSDPVSRSAIQGFSAHCLSTGSEPSTARLRHYAIKSFFGWLRAEGEITADPFAGLPPPRLHVKITASLTDEQIHDLIKTCSGGSFTDRRDEAMMRFLFDTGVRSMELLDMDVDDVELGSLSAVVLKGKGGKGRVVPFTAPTAAAVDRYLRARRGRVKPGVDKMWIGSTRGTPLGYDAMYYALKNRARRAGVTNFHPHKTRHTAATRWLRHGGSEAGLMAIAGWSSRSMIDRYTAASASERALDEARRLDLGL